MKFVVSLLLFLYSFPLFAGEVCFLNVVNMVPSKHPLKVALNGKILMPSGLKSGDTTGWFRISNCELNVLIKPDKNQPWQLQQKFQLSAKSSHLIVIYPIPVKEAPEELNRLGATIFPAYPSKRYSLKFVSLFSQSNSFQIGSSSVVAKPLKPLPIPQWRGQQLPISAFGESIAETERAKDGGSFYLFVNRWRGRFVTCLVRANPQASAGN